MKAKSVDSEEEFNSNILQGFIAILLNILMCSRVLDQ